MDGENSQLFTESIQLFAESRQLFTELSTLTPDIIRPKTRHFTESRQLFTESRRLFNESLNPTQYVPKECCVELSMDGESASIVH
jgi:hypothetical protein